MAKPHVAVFAFPFGSHAAPLLTLVRKLAAEAPGAAFSFFSTAKSNASISAIVAACGELSNVGVYDVWDGVEKGKTVGPREAMGHFLSAVPGNLQEALKEAAAPAEGRGEVTCVLSDAFLWMTEEMAAEMGVPWVVLATAGPGSVTAHLYTDLLRQTYGVGQEAMAKLDEPVTCIPSLLPTRVGDLPQEVLLADPNSLFSRLLHATAAKFPRAAAIVFNSYDGLDPPILAHLQTKLRACLPVGPLHLSAALPPGPDPHSCLPFLDRAASPVAYISFGTVASPPQHEFAALAAGVEASGAPFLWSLKDPSALPEGFLERTRGRGLVVAWAPQTAVLQHAAVGVFVTHCGWNSMVESVASGVPMICRPFLGEQMMMSKIAAEVWGVAVAAEDGVFKEEGVVEALDLVLKKEEGKRMKEKAVAMKMVAHEAVKEGGSSTKNFQSLLEIITVPVSPSHV